MATAPTLHETLINAALSYAQRGLPVFPCHADNKRPLTKNGFKDASTSPAMVTEWWAKWPNAMIGMPTGEASGVWVLDVDDVDLFERECKISLTATRQASTGEGYHRYYESYLRHTNTE